MIFRAPRGLSNETDADFSVDFPACDLRAEHESPGPCRRKTGKGGEVRKIVGRQGETVDQRDRNHRR